MKYPRAFRSNIVLTIILIVGVQFLGASLYAQADTMPTKKLTVVKKQSGKSMVHSEPGKFRLYATFADRKITGYYAVDESGKRTEATFKRNQQGSTSAVLCAVCVFVNGVHSCFLISCDDVPPKKKD